VKKDPDNSGYYSKLGFTVFSLGKLEEAKVTFTKAVSAVLVGGAQIQPRALTEHLQIQANLRNWSRREELNLQPTHYECDLRPFS